MPPVDETATTVAFSHELVAVSSIAPHPKNDNRGNVQAIMESLKKFGQMRDIVVSKDDLILAGNGTWAAAQELGYAQIAIARVDADYETGLAYLEADNQIARLAERDVQQTAANLELLGGAGWQLGELGFSEDHVEDVMSQAGRFTDDEGLEAGYNYTQEEASRHFGGDGTETEIPAAVPTKDVGLSYNEQDFETFRIAVRTLQKEWGVTSVAAVVLESVRRASQ